MYLPPVPRRGFRFSPPRVDYPPELRWLLLATFGRPEPPPPRDLDVRSIPTLATLAFQFDLGPRLFARLGRRKIVEYLGETAARQLVSSALVALGGRERSRAGLPFIAEIAERRQIPVLFLKGTALELGGYSKLGWRNSLDVDVLLRSADLAAFSDELEGKGWRIFRATDPDQDHSLPVLFHRQYGRIEMHWCIPGLDLGGRRRFARLEDVESAGETQPAPELNRFCRIPSRDLLSAHVLVHGLAQHGFALDYPFFRIVSDLIDLDVEKPPEQPWTSRALSMPEALAACLLARRLASADLTVFDATTARVPEASLLAHFVAATTDETYATTLRLKSAWTFLADGPIAFTVVRRVGRTLFPDAEQLERLYGPPKSRWSRPLQRLLRPLDLALRLTQRLLAWAILRLRG